MADAEKDHNNDKERQTTTIISRVQRTVLSERCPVVVPFEIAMPISEARKYDRSSYCTE